MAESLSQPRELARCAPVDSTQRASAVHSQYPRERKQAQSVGKRLKIVKLTLTALATLGVLIGIISVSAPQLFRENYLCWTQAVSFSSCYGSGPIEFVAAVDGIKYEGVTGNYVDTHIFYYGAYEKPILFLLRDILRSAYAGQGTFIDIGANTGQHSLMMARYAKSVHAFEPWEPVLKRFRRMVTVNGIKNIAIHAYGLGDENSQKPFFQPGEKNLGTGSFVESFQPQNSLAGELEIKKGDDAFRAEGIDAVSVIKMDIEGYEKLALRGLGETLKKHRPVMVFELSINPKSPVSIKSRDELVALFPGEYEFLVISEKSDPQSGAYFLEPIAGTLNFTKTEQHDLLAYPIERRRSLPLHALKH